MRRKKRNKARLFIMLLILIFGSVYGGLKGGEYFAKKLTEPIQEDKNLLDGGSILTEDDMVDITAVTAEFISAEHNKKEDRLSVLVHPDYYSSFLKSMKSITSGDALIEDMNYKAIDKNKVKLQVIYIKNSKKSSETITWQMDNKTWSVVKVDR